MQTANHNDRPASLWRTGATLALLLKQHIRRNRNTCALPGPGFCTTGTVASTAMPRFAPTHCAPGAARKRLPATLRTTHILDAAQTMCAMKARAFAPTDAVEAIVAAACLFQGGTYTRFDSKQDSVETLHPRGVASSLPLATRTSPCSPFNRSSQQHASAAGPIEPVRLFHQMPGHPDRVTSLHPKLTCGVRVFLQAIRRSGHCMVAVP